MHSLHLAGAACVSGHMLFSDSQMQWIIGLLVGGGVVAAIIIVAIAVYLRLRRGD